MPTINYYGQGAAASSGPQYLKAEYNASLALPIQIPTWAKRLRLVLIGAGGGSGSGARGALTANAQGGSSGSAGGRTIGEYSLVDLAAYFGLTAADLYYLPQIGLAGTSGAAVTTDNANGNNGSSGGTSYFRLRNNAGTISKIIAQACGGAPGQGGQRAAGTTLGGSVIGGPCTFPGAQGVAGANNNGVPGNGTNESPGSGGSGAGFFGIQPLTSGAIGTPSVAGSFTATATTYTISGTGSYANSPDSFHYASTSPPIINCDWIGQPVFSSAGVGAAVGIMVRDGLANNAPFFAVELSGGIVSGRSRSTVGGVSISLGASSLGSGFYLRLVKTGNVFSAQYATAITGPWTALGSTTIVMNAPRVGIFIASNITNTLATATFTNLNLSSTGGAASASGLGGFGLITGSTLPGANATTTLPPGVPGLGGGGGSYSPFTPGASGGSGFRGGSGGGGSASSNGFISGAGGISGNGYACVELFSY